MQHTRFTLLSIGFALLLFLGMVLFIELGRRLGVRQFEKIGEDAKVGVGIVDSAVYAVLALLIGFLFSGAATRFDNRRELVLKEVDAFGTAWQRIDLLPSDAQPVIRGGVQRYLDALILTYAQPPGTAEELHHRDALEHAEQQLWTDAVQVSLTDRGEKARMLLLPELNDGFDAVELEWLSQRIHPPRLIWVMLGVAALAAALFAGYSIASRSSRNWVHIIGIAATISIATFAIIELESPRLGLIRMDAIDQTLMELRAKMGDGVSASGPLR